MSNHTPGPWTLCHHLSSIDNDIACECGYRGVIYGPDDKAICQPGHDKGPKGQELTVPERYNREIEIANAYLIAAAPDMLAALKEVASIKNMPMKIQHINDVIAKAEGRINDESLIDIIDELRAVKDSGWSKSLDPHAELLQERYDNGGEQDGGSEF